MLSARRALYGISPTRAVLPFSRNILLQSRHATAPTASCELKNISSAPQRVITSSALPLCTTSVPQESRFLSRAQNRFFSSLITPSRETVYRRQEQQQTNRNNYQHWYRRQRRTGERTYTSYHEQPPESGYKVYYSINKPYFFKYLSVIALLQMFVLCYMGYFALQMAREDASDAKRAPLWQRAMLCAGFALLGIGTLAGVAIYARQYILELGIMGDGRTVRMLVARYGWGHTEHRFPLSNLSAEATSLDLLRYPPGSVLPAGVSPKRDIYVLVNVKGRRMTYLLDTRGKQLYMDRQGLLNLFSGVRQINLSKPLKKYG